MLLCVVAVGCCLLAVAFYRHWGRQSKWTSHWKEMPSETGLPLIGIVKEVGGSLSNYLVRLSRKHGPIYRVRFGLRDVVVFNNYEYLRAVLVEQGAAFSGRWRPLRHIMVTGGQGIIYADGDVWLEQKAFLLKLFKDFGLGGSRTAEIVQNECRHLLEDLVRLQGGRVDFSHFVPVYIANVIAQFIMSRRFERDDAQLRLIQSTLEVVADKKDAVCALFLMCPFVDERDWLMGLVSWLASRRAVFADSHALFEREIASRARQPDCCPSEGADLMDRFRAEQRRLRERDGRVGSFTDWQLVKVSLELMMAGFDTSALTLTWSLMFMATHPAAQERVHREVVAELGGERLPAMRDRARLPYTQAVMDEAMRLASIVPISVFRRALARVCVKGYVIPKDTVVITNLFACHLDPLVWERPTEFHPDHFLSADAGGAARYRAREELVPFGMGRRQCLGEALARTEYFIFFASIMQRFRVALAPGVAQPARFDVFDVNDGLLRAPKLKEFVFHSYSEDQ